LIVVVDSSNAIISINANFPKRIHLPFRFEEFSSTIFAGGCIAVLKFKSSEEEVSASWGINKKSYD
jgi:hypothetical protein